jgi:hypothetical protein
MHVDQYMQKARETAKAAESGIHLSDVAALQDLKAWGEERARRNLPIFRMDESTRSRNEAWAILQRKVFWQVESVTNRHPAAMDVDGQPSGPNSNPTTLRPTTRAESISSRASSASSGVPNLIDDKQRGHGSRRNHGAGSLRQMCARLEAAQTTTSGLLAQHTGQLTNLATRVLSLEGHRQEIEEATTRTGSLALQLQQITTSQEDRIRAEEEAIQRILLHLANPQQVRLDPRSLMISSAPAAADPEFHVSIPSTPAAASSEGRPPSKGSKRARTASPSNPPEDETAQPSPSLPAPRIPTQNHPQPNPSSSRPRDTTTRQLTFAESVTHPTKNSSKDAKAKAPTHPAKPAGSGAKQ